MNRPRCAIAAAALTAAFLVGAPPAAEAQRWQSHTVYVVNHSTWPARQAAASISRGSGLRVVVVSSCRHRRQCVVITQRRLSGRVATTYYGGAPYREYASIVVTSRRLSRHERLGGMCHELGHAVGLRHSRSKASCMFWRVGRDVSATVGPARATLRRMYG